MKIEIEPYPINPEIDHIHLRVNHFELGADDMWVDVVEYTKQDKFLNLSRVYIPPEIYSEWGTCDDYIIEYCLNHLGFERRRELYLHFL